MADEKPTDAEVLYWLNRAAGPHEPWRAAIYARAAECVRLVMDRPTTPDCPKHGVERRDYFACAAMEGILASPTENGITCDSVAASAYRMADAMERARAPRAAP